MGLLFISFIIYGDQISKCLDYYEAYNESIFLSEVTHLASSFFKWFKIKD